MAAAASTAKANPMATVQGQRLSDAAFSGDAAKVDAILAEGIPVNAKDNVSG
jgi:hypothetical protein